MQLLLLLVPDGVATAMTQHAAHLLGDARRHCDSGDATRLNDGDRLAAGRPARLVQILRQLGALTAARLANNHYKLAVHAPQNER